MYKLFFIFFVGLGYFSAAEATRCGPHKVILKFPEEVESQYLRISPDGRYLLYTYMPEGKAELAQVHLAEILYEKGQWRLKIYDTPLKSEAFPIEPNWDYLASPFDEGNLKFFRTSDILRNESLAKEVGRDPFNEYYSSAGGTAENFKILNWTFMAAKQFDVIGGKIKANGGGFFACPNLLKIDALGGDKEFQDWFIKRTPGSFIDLLDEISLRIYRRQSAKFGKDYARSKRSQETDSGFFTDELQKLKKEGRVNEEDARQILKYHNILDKIFDKGDENGSSYYLENPMLSPDGNYIGGVYGGVTRIYQLNADHSCTEVQSLGARTSKVTFSYPDTSGKTKYVVFTQFYRDGEDPVGNLSALKIFDIEKNKTIDIDNSKRFTYLTYGKLTRNGRLMAVGDNYLYIWDANRVLGTGRRCVTMEEIRKIHAPSEGPKSASSSKTVD